MIEFCLQSKPVLTIILFTTTAKKIHGNITGISSRDILTVLNYVKTRAVMLDEIRTVLGGISPYRKVMWVFQGLSINEEMRKWMFHGTKSKRRL